MKDEGAEFFFTPTSLPSYVQHHPALYLPRHAQLLNEGGRLNRASALLDSLALFLFKDSPGQPLDIHRRRSGPELNQNTNSLFSAQTLRSTFPGKIDFFLQITGAQVKCRNGIIVGKTQLKTRYFLSGVCLLIATSAAAETVNYICNMTKQDSHGWIPKEYAFRIDAAAGRAHAASSYQDWAEARFKDRGSKGYRLSWNLTERTSQGHNQRVRYQADLNKENNALSVTMTFLHTQVSNKPRGSGSCVMSK